VEEEKIQWACGICGYLHDDEEPPDSCPVCGAPKNKFAEYNGEPTDEDLEKGQDDMDDFDRDLYGDYDE
jgi:hypothetical protein